MSDSWTDDIEGLRGRLADLIGRADLVDDTRVLAGEALEKLAVVVEELQAQNAELIASRTDLESERERYRTLFETMPDGYVVTDSHGILLEANATAAELFGQSRRKLVGKPLASHIEPSDRGAFYAQLARLRRNGPGGHLDLNLVLRGADGVAANLRANVSAQQLDDDPRIRWLIHDRRPDLVHRDLRVSEERLRGLFDTAHVGFVLADTASCLVFANQRADELLRRRRNDVASDDWLRAVHPDDVGRVRDALAAASSEGEVSALRHRVCEPGGGTRWVDHGVSPFCAADGIVSGSVSTLADVTAEHDATIGKSESTDFADAIINTVGALVVVLGPAGEIQRFNQACEEVTGFTAADMIGQHAVDVLVPADQAAAVRRVFADLVASGSSNRCENDWITAAGGRRTITWTNTVLTEADGSVRAIIGTGLDITGTKALEARLEHVARLESVGRLAAGVAHDFNNTLSTLQLRVDRLARHLSGDAGTQDRDAALSTIDRTRHVIADLLSFGGQQTLIARPLDLDHEVRHTVSLLEDLLSDDIEFELELHSGCPTVAMDPGRFEQALTNLVLNARDAMPDGGTITVATSAWAVTHRRTAADSPPDLAPGPYGTVTVTDTGGGIEPADLAQIFDPYFTTKPPSSGTGLGLATTFGTMAQSGGGISVESRLGVGSSFTLWIPVAEAGASSTPGDSESHFDPDDDRPILIVDDDPDVLSVLRQEIARLGHATLTAANPAQALAHRDTSLRMLITDVQLPDIDGAELAAMFLRTQPDLNVLFISGASSAVLRDKVPERARVLRKPFSTDELVAMVGRRAELRPAPS